MLAVARGLDDNEGSSHGNLQNRVLSTFLNELDGVLSSTTPATIVEDLVFVVVACKDIDALDAALLRPGRLHAHVHLPIPTRAAFQEIVTLYLQALPCGEDVHVREMCNGLVDRLDAMGSPLSGALAEAFVAQARAAALRSAIERGADGAEVRVSKEHFLRAMQDLAPSPLPSPTLLSPSVAFPRPSAPAPLPFLPGGNSFSFSMGTQ